MIGRGSSSLAHHVVEANGVRFHYAEQGSGPLVLLLHGFPECWYSWRKQLPSLAAAGFRAVAPDLRGYNLSDKPRSGYRIESLVDDVVAIATALGGERADLVGHDWGGIIAWQAAWRRPDFVRKLTILNAPHPAAFSQYAARHPSQMLKSSYMLFFLAPRVPEWLLTRDRAAAVASAFRRSARNQRAFTDEDIEVYRAAFLRPGAATCALNYYREALRQGPGALPAGPITVPTLVLWGVDDPVLEKASNDRLGEWVTDLRFEPIAECGHWTQQEQPELVNERLIQWLGG